MKRILPILLSVLLFNNSFAQNNTDWKKSELKGKVKSFVLLENYRYKKNGQFTEWTILYNHKYAFDNTGRYLEFVESNAAGELTYKIQYSYNKKENKAAVNYLDKNEKPIKQNEWLYNTNGQLTETQEYTKENKPDWRYVYTYDAKGNRIEMVSYRPDGSFYSKTTYTFDANGNETSSLLQTKGYANSGRRATYDSKGNKTEELWLNGKNEVDFRFLRTYDGNGNVTEEIKYRGQDKLLGKTTWKYEYDKKNNWIKKTQYTSDGIDYDVAERKIVYY